MPQLMEARIDIETIIKDALKAKKMGSRKLAANMLMHDSVSVFESRDPIEDVRKPARKNVIKAPAPLESGLDEVLPDLKIESTSETNSDEGMQP